MRSVLPTTEDLFADLSGQRDGVGDWRSYIKAPRTVPSGEPVSRWYLASFFLRKWAHDYAVACRKIPLAHAGVPELRPPARSSVRRYEYQALEWASDPMLDTVLSEQLALEWDRDGSDSDGIDEKKLFSQTVEAHEWAITLSVLTNVATSGSTDFRERILPLTIEAVRGLTGQVFRSRAAAQQQAVRIADKFLMRCRASTGSFSWKPFCQGVERYQVKDPLFAFRGEFNMDDRAIDAVVADLRGRAEVPRQIVRTVLERIADAIAQQGYDGFAREARSGGLFADGVLGANEQLLNVIPGNSKDQCRPLLLAVARGGKGKTGMKAIAK